MTNYLIEFLGDRVNLVNILAGVAAFWLRYLAGLSEVISLITPLVLFVSAISVCAYNVIKFYRILKNKK